jgi:hypothetical protein
MPTLKSQPLKIKRQALENLQIMCTYKKSQPGTAKVKPPYIFQMVID